MIKAIARPWIAGQNTLDEDDSVTTCSHVGEAPASSITVPGIERDIEVKFATEQAEFEAAFCLLARNYQAKGYELPSPKLFRFTPYHLLPDTWTIVAKHGEQVVGTMSVVPDTYLLGLPLECIYSREIAALRRQGCRLAEATSLADENLCMHEFIRVFTVMIRLGIQAHLHNGGDSWVITVNPRHRAFYRRVLGFESLGPLRSYPAVQNAPAEAYWCNVGIMRTNAPAMYETILRKSLPEAVLAAPPWSIERIRYFGDQSSQTDMRLIDRLLVDLELFGSAPRWRESESKSMTLIWPSSPCTRRAMAEVA